MPPPLYVGEFLNHLKESALDKAQRFPKLRHMIVFPKGEGIDRSLGLGVRPLGTFSTFKKPRLTRFGETKLVGPLPPRQSWPSGATPYKAVVVGSGIVPQSTIEEPERSHLLFDGSDPALRALKTIAASFADIRTDLQCALENCGRSRGDVVVCQSCVASKAVEQLDGLLCTTHLWAWEAPESSIHTKPRVVLQNHAYDVDWQDTAVVSKLSFSFIDSNVFTSSAVMLGLLLKVLDNARQGIEALKSGDGLLLDEPKPDVMQTRHVLKRNLSKIDARAWSRLEITDGAGGAVAELDGESHRLRSVQDAAFLRALQSKEGLPISAMAFEDMGMRPDRVYKRLPAQLQEIIDKPGRGQKGYRMR